MRNITIDYSPLSIFQNADPVVQGIILGLTFASIISWWIMIDRTLKIRSELQSIRLIQVDLLETAGTDGLRDVCERVPSSGARILAVMLDEWTWSMASVEKNYDQIRVRLMSGVDLAVARESSKLSGATSLLATVGSIAPFVGLFGTVWGIMSSFMAIGQSQDTSLAVVAPGIAEALMATAIGLLCAIPAVVGYNRLLQSLGDVSDSWRSICGQVEIGFSRQFGSVER